MLSDMSLGDAMKVALKYDLTKKVERTLDLGNDNDIIPKTCGRVCRVFVQKLRRLSTRESRTRQHGPKVF
jgi:hypothetical protein